MKLLPGTSPRRRRGFTAIEIAMVASVIAIIALLILPLFRQRTEEARKTAANDELASIAKAELLIEADTGIQVRLNDLDNGLEDSNNAAINPDIEPPIAAWNGTLETVVPKTRATVVSSWKGPYAAYRNYRTFDELNVATSNPGAFFTENDGPIYHVIGSNSYTGGVVDFGGDRYPVDPWGQPYLFFGIGKLDLPSFTGESTFNSSVVYSTGPNGVPGNQASQNLPDDYRRDNGVLGDPLTDDLEYRF